MLLLFTVSFLRRTHPTLFCRGFCSSAFTWVKEMTWIKQHLTPKGVEVTSDQVILHAQQHVLFFVWVKPWNYFCLRYVSFFLHSTFWSFRTSIFPRKNPALPVIFIIENTFCLVKFVFVCFRPVFLNYTCLLWSFWSMMNLAGSWLVFQPVLGGRSSKISQAACWSLTSPKSLNFPTLRQVKIGTPDGTWNIMEYRFICIHGWIWVTFSQPFYIGDSLLDEPLAGKPIWSISQSLDPERTPMARLFPVIPNYGHTWTSVSYPRTVSLPVKMDRAIAASRCNRCRVMQFVTLYVSNLCKTMVNVSLLHK